MGTVQYSPFTAVFENGASGSVITGSPGSGKTFFLLNVLSNCVLMKQRIFAIDPKDDLGVLSEVFPGEIEYIDVNNIQPGSLNPFAVLDDINTITLTSIISIICGGLTSKQKTSVTPILNDFINRSRRRPKSVSFTDVANYLYAHDDSNAREVGVALEIVKDSKYGKLLFTDDLEEDKTNDFVFTAKSKIVSLHGMDLPVANAKKITEEQRFNSAIVYIICKMIRQKLVSGGYPTLITIDEAHIAYQNEDFAKLIDDFLVLGRSLNCPTILASQSTGHYPDGIDQFVSSRFCFKSSTKNALQFLNTFLPTDELEGVSSDYGKIASKINNFNTGECFYVDKKNRAGFVKIVSSFDSSVTSNPLEKAKQRQAQKEKEEKEKEEARLHGQNKFN